MQNEGQPQMTPVQPEVMVVTTPDTLLTQEQVEIKNKINAERAELTAMMAEFGEKFNSLDDANVEVARALVEELQQKAEAAGLFDIGRSDAEVQHSGDWRTGEQLS